MRNSMQIEGNANANTKQPAPAAAVIIISMSLDASAGNSVIALARPPSGPSRACRRNCGLLCVACRLVVLMVLVLVC